MFLLLPYFLLPTPWLLLLLLLHLFGAVESHVRLAAIEPDQTGDADVFVEIELLRVAEFAAVEAPDDGCEHVVGIRLAEI